MTDISKFELISNVIALINSEEYVSTITNISNSLKMPIQYIRRTILSLLNNQVLQTCIRTQDDYETDDEEATFIEEYLESPEDITNELLDGVYDDTVWNIDLRILDSDDQVLLPLTHLEYGILKSLGEDIISLRRGSIFEKKETVNPILPSVQKCREVIQDAIYVGKQVHFSYPKFNEESNKYEPHTVTCFPQDIITNISDNWIYMQSTELKLYRLDRIIPPCRIVNNSPAFPGITEVKNKKYIWGAFSKRDDTPVHVKLRIAPETGNIVSKIKRDTALRNATNKFYQDGNFYYYEDDIIGIEEFQRWLRGYGSSIVVIEPASLRDSITQRAQQALVLYEASKTWEDL